MLPLPNGRLRSAHLVGPKARKRLPPRNKIGRIIDDAFREPIRPKPAANALMMINRKCQIGINNALDFLKSPRKVAA